MNSIDPLIHLQHGALAGAGAGDEKRRAFKFALGFLIFTALVGAWLWWRRQLPGPAVAVSCLGLLLLAATAIKPRFVLGVRSAWLTAAGYLGKFNTLVILTLLYFLAVVPIGLIGRLFGRDRLGLRRRNDASSYWHSRVVQRDPKHFERPY
jgi:hypothetical protein